PRVEFARLGLVVVDEQHRFGVAQRAALRTRGRRQGRHPDLLVMTATPIPRSLALTLYGDLDVSRIDELPPGREPVRTEVLGPDRRAEAVEAIAAVADAGARAFVVAPRIEESDDDEVLSVEEVAAELRGALPDARVVTLHGGMEPADKAAAMEEFAAGRAPVLVATTVVEVGVDVPAATLVVVEHAERFGLAQLHQLRGRVGRGERSGRCLLLAHPPLTDTARARLRALVRTTDGFRLAEEDLRLRGPGEVLGTRQTGAFGLRVGDPFAHPEWLERAHAVARRLASSDEDEAVAYRDTLRRAWARRLRLARSG
ncbi:MAG: helicase-related protein, partial [Acidobacteriota bacterium]